MWPFAVTVLPCQASAGDWLSLALAVHISCCTCTCTWRSITAAVGVHPRQKVCMCPSLVEAVVAGHSATPTAHLDEWVALRLVTRHRHATLSGSLWDHLLLEWSWGRGRGGRGNGGGGSGVIGGWGGWRRGYGRGWGGVLRSCVQTFGEGVPWQSGGTIIRNRFRLRDLLLVMETAAVVAVMVAVVVMVCPAVIMVIVMIVVMSVIMSSRGGRRPGEQRGRGGRS